jgi:hypothetical protein
MAISSDRTHVEEIMRKKRNMKILDTLSFAAIAFGVLYFGVHILIFLLRR